MLLIFFHISVLLSITFARQQIAVDIALGYQASTPDADRATIGALDGYREDRGRALTRLGSCPRAIGTFTRAR